MNKACFFDRDGIINEMVFDKENDLIRTPLNTSEVIIDYAITSTIKETKKLGYLNILISNQPNIGLERMTESMFKNITFTVKAKLKEEGVVLDAEYYCFHHPFSKLKKFRVDCNCRKPKTGLFIKAAKELNIDLKKSWVIGDGIYDVIAGKELGCKTILVSNAAIETGYYSKIIERLANQLPDFIVKNNREVLEIIKKEQ